MVWMAYTVEMCCLIGSKSKLKGWVALVHFEGCEKDVFPAPLLASAGSLAFLGL